MATVTTLAVVVPYCRCCLSSRHHCVTVEFFDFLRSRAVIPAIEKQYVAVSDGIQQGGMVLGPIAIGRHEHAKCAWINQSGANRRRSYLVMHIRIERSGVCEVAHRFVFGN